MGPKSPFDLASTVQARLGAVHDHGNGANYYQQALNAHSHTLAQSINNHSHSHTIASTNLLDSLRRMSKDELVEYTVDQMCKVQDAERKMQDILGRFKGIFEVDSTDFRVREDMPPERPGHWRVRVTVPARTYETTLDEMVLARMKPHEAFSWQDQLRLRNHARETALRVIEANIVVDCVSENNPMVSIEPLRTTEIEQGDVA